MEKRNCACVDDDAQVCFRLRYPKDAEWDYYAQCQCSCHDEILEDEQDDEDELVEKQIGKMAVIEWTDCCYNSGNTHTKDELLEFGLAHMHTIGWIIEHEDSWLIYDEFNSGEKNYRHIINIPKSGIVKITYLQAKRNLENTENPNLE